MLEQEGSVRCRSSRSTCPRAHGARARRTPVTFGELLAVRLRAGVRTVGILVLANRPGAGHIGPDADELLAELGRALGSAMDNALLLREVLHARRWMRAATTLTQQLLGDEIDDPLREVSERAMDLANADYTVVALIQGTHMHVQHVSGLGEVESLRNRRRLAARSPPRWTTCERGDALVYGDLSQVRSEAFEGMDTSSSGPALIIPLIGAESLTGVLLLGRFQDNPPFTHSELDLASALRRAGLGRPRARVGRAGPGEAAAGRGARPDRARPARPRRAAPVRHRVVAARGRQPAGGRQPSSAFATRCSPSTRPSGRSATRS